MKQHMWDIVIAEVSRPLLGADFLRANSLLVDLRGKGLMDAKAYFSSPFCEAGAPALHLSTISRPGDEYDKLLANFPEISKPNFSTLHTKHGVEHFIKTTGLLIHARLIGYPQRGWLQPRPNFSKWNYTSDHSNSQWASPLHMVPKASGGWHLCADYMHLNEVTIPDW